MRRLSPLRLLLAAAALWPLEIPAASTVGKVSGTVFDDGDADGSRDAGEAGLAGVVVSDGVRVTISDGDGRYVLEPGETRHVFVVVPGDRRPSGAWYQERRAVVDFPLARARLAGQWRFAHLSDSHVRADNVGRLRDALQRAAGGGAELALVSGDLIKDALRVGEEAARAQYELYAAEAARSPIPVRSAIGNHEVFGIERHESLVPRTHPLYAKAMFEHYLGPRYYAFNRGRVHFIVLDTVGVDDLWYYGLLDEEQLRWIGRELEHVPKGTVVVTVGHIPLRSGRLSAEYAAQGPGRTLHTADGQTGFRHVVRNTADLTRLLAPYRWTLALQGHTHLAERLRLWDGGSTRYHTAPSVEAKTWAPGPSGLFVYTVRDDVIDDGELVVLDP